MGQTLSEPMVEKHTTTGEDLDFGFGVSDMQGWRLTMEDAHAAVLDLESAPPLPPSNPNGSDEKRHVRFFAVYDGHGGSTVAKFSGDTVHFRLRSTQEYQNGDYVAALKRAFLATDEDLRSNADFKNDPSGCTAVAALITPTGEIHVANAGDSRSVLSVNGVAEPMSYDHKPVNRGESNRIAAAGGFVEFGRVNGNLALSRAIGDFEFKQNKNLPPEKQVVTADPDIISHQITSEDEFLILACDGIWDVYSNQQVVDLVRSLIAMRHPLDRIAEMVLDHCIAPDCEWGGVGCDNMTCMIVAIYGGKTKEQWYDMICERVKNGEGYETPSNIPDPFSRSRRNENTSNIMHQPNSAVGSNNNDGGSPLSYQNSSGQLSDESSVGPNTGPSVGSLFSLAPVSIIEALSRVSNASNFDPPTPQPNNASIVELSDSNPNEDESTTNHSESNTEPALSSAATDQPHLSTLDA